MNHSLNQIVGLFALTLLLGSAGNALAAHTPADVEVGPVAGIWDTAVSTTSSNGVTVSEICLRQDNGDGTFTELECKSAAESIPYAGSATDHLGEPVVIFSTTFTISDARVELRAFTRSTSGVESPQSVNARIIDLRIPDAPVILTP